LLNADGTVGPIVLQNPLPGHRGTMPMSLQALGKWRFDANLGKTFQITESKSLQVRFDALNVLNHPQPGTPTFNINAVDLFGNPLPFGQITSKSGTRTMQGQLRFTF